MLVSEWNTAGYLARGPESAAFYSALKLWLSPPTAEFYFAKARNPTHDCSGNEYR
jgi:hypothetical protein